MRGFRTGSTILGGFRTTGPLVQLVPDFDSVIGPVQPTSCGVWIDDGEEGDGLWQPGETVDLHFCIQNRGPEPFTGVVGTVSSPATPVLSPGIPFMHDTSAIPDLPGFPAGTFDCVTNAFVLRNLEDLRALDEKLMGLRHRLRRGERLDEI